MRRPVVSVLGVSALVACLAAVNRFREPGAVEFDWTIARPGPRPAIAERPTRGPIARAIAAQGIVEPSRETKVLPGRAARVAAVEVAEGDVVREGDVLVRLDDAPARSRLGPARSRLDAARAALARAEAEVREAGRDPAPRAPAPAPPAAPPIGPRPPAPPAAPGAGAAAKVVAARAAAEAGRREVAAAEAQVAAVRLELDRSEVRSTMAGVVEGVAVAPGDEVAPATPGAPPGPPLMAIFDPERLRVRALVDEADAPLVRKGQAARVFLASEPRRPLSGVVDRVGARGRPAGQVVAFPTWLAVDDPDRRLRAGMRANVEIEVLRKDDALGVPVQAVLSRRREELPDTPAVRAWAARSGPWPGSAREAEARLAKIVIVVEGGAAHLRPVETGLSDERRVEVAWGLSARDRVVVGPFRALDELREGDPVALPGGGPAPEAGGGPR